MKLPKFTLPAAMRFSALRSLQSRPSSVAAAAAAPREFRLIGSRRQDEGHTAAAVPTGGPYYYDCTHAAWLQVSGGCLAAAPPLGPESRLNVATWNIDFVAPHPCERARAVLACLRRWLRRSPYDGSAGSVVLLQEVRYLRNSTRSLAKGGEGEDGTQDSALEAILSDGWVQSEFYITSVSIPGRYGTVTLVSKTLPIATTTTTTTTNPPLPPQSQTQTACQKEKEKGEEEREDDSGSGGIHCFRVPAPGTIFGRDILCVDLLVRRGGDLGGGRDGILRICNVHLDSGDGHGVQARPAQLACASTLVRAGPGVVAGIVAGDMNPCAPSDAHQHENIGLTDVWVEHVGQPAALAFDLAPIASAAAGAAAATTTSRNSSSSSRSSTCGEEACHTWGYQSPARAAGAYPPKRLDKILFYSAHPATLRPLPAPAGTSSPLSRLGVGESITLDAPTQTGQQESVVLSDHFGLLTRFVISA